MELDLKPYGINYILKPNKASLEGINHEHLLFGKFTSETLELGDKTYTRTKKLGEGTYGAAFEVIDEEGKKYAVKKIKSGISGRIDFRVFINEVIMQIILAETSKDEKNGPYVPMIYKVAYYPPLKQAYILCELMENTFTTLVNRSLPKENNLVIPHAFLEISNILKFFGEKLKFNHRDLKGDNIMYKKTPDSNFSYVLIDFGFSCLDWNGLKIYGGDYFSSTRECFRHERDLAQLVYYCLFYLTPQLSREMQVWLKQLLTTMVRDEECELGNGCILNKRKLVKDWKDTYDFLNRYNVRPKYTSPNILTEKTFRFLDKKNFVSPVPAPAPAPASAPAPRCKEANARIASLMKKPCAEGKERNPKTGRCITKKQKKKNAPKHEKTCPPGKILNPATRRCVKETGAIGKKIKS